MKVCPFCNFNEGLIKESPLNMIEKHRNEKKYVVQCQVCGTLGPESLTKEDAESKWNGSLFEDAMGGVSAPMATLNNVPGIGNAVPASAGSIGSGDLFGKPINKKPYTQAVSKKISIRKKTKKAVSPFGAPKKIVKENLVLAEENLNPYDKVGVAIAKKMKVPQVFRKKKSRTNEVTQKQFEHVITFEEFAKEQAKKNKSRL